MSLGFVKPVVFNMLKIQEAPTQGGSVVVHLRVGPLAYAGATYHFGQMSYGVNEIDIVQVSFPNSGISGSVGLVELQIMLANGNTFLSNNPVSTVPTTTPTPKQQKLHCIEVDTSHPAKGTDCLTLKFLEPKEGEFVAYPTLYFITAQGIVDPGVSVKRGTGN